MTFILRHSVTFVVDMKQRAECVSCCFAAFPDRNLRLADVFLGFIQFFLSRLFFFLLMSSQEEKTAEVCSSSHSTVCACVGARMCFAFFFFFFLL